MKIKKKAKLPTLECDLCGCVFVPSKEDLKCDIYKDINSKSRKDDLIDRVYTNCPICGLISYVFKEKVK